MELRTLIVICTYNEPGIAQVLRKVYYNTSALKNSKADILVIDDSNDDYTLDQLRYFKEYLDLDNRFSYIHRKTKTGLGSAIIQGLTIAKDERYNFALVMDGDGQHPSSLIPLIINLAGYYDLVLPSRFIEGASSKGLDGLIRSLFSSLLRWIPKLLFFKKLRLSSDPLSGYFLVKLSTLDINKLKDNSWKVLLEILIFGNHKYIREIPYTFKERNEGVSKMTVKQGISFLKHLVDLMIRYYV